MHDADITIIGAGAIGCALAQHLSKTYPDRSIVVLEKLHDVGLETSRFNSGVLHTGLHENPNFLKARLAREGSQLAVAYAQAHKIPILSSGMIIAIPRNALWNGLWHEWKNLWHLYTRGREQQVPFTPLTPWGIRKHEPNIRALGGIFIPAVWVIDPRLFTKTLGYDAHTRNVTFLFNHEITKISATQNGYRINCDCQDFTTRCIINAAGLYADDIARMAGFTQYKIYPWRGEYYQVIGEKKNLVRGLVYPAVPPGSPGKGIHFSPRVDGSLYLGPNARPVPQKNYYVEDKTPPEVFLNAVRGFCPELTLDDLQWGYSGIRPKLTNFTIESDFVISLDREDPPFVNLIGIESPGLSSSMAIARYVTNLLHALV